MDGPLRGAAHLVFPAPEGGKKALDIGAEPAKLAGTNMKSNSVTAILQGALAFSLLLSIIFFLQFFFKSREAAQLRAQIMQYQQLRGRITQLVGETVEYSKRNPSIDPILVSAGIKPGPAVGKPTAK